MIPWIIAGTPDGWRLKGSLLLHLSVFLAGFVFVLVGMAAGHTALGRLFLLGQRGMTVLGGVLTAVMGLFMTGLVPRAAQGDVRLRFRHRFFGYAASAAMGVTYGLVWSPCVGPTLGLLILLAGAPDTGTVRHHDVVRVRHPASVRGAPPSARSSGYPCVT